MENENLAQIGESYIQAVQKEEQEQRQKEQQQQERLQQQEQAEMKILGDLLCRVVDIIFARKGWEKLRIEEKQLLGDSFVGVMRKRAPGVIKWSDEIKLGVAIAMIIATRIGVNEVKKCEKEYENEEKKGSSNSSDIGPPRRGKNLFLV